MSSPALVITGATATGKTALSIEVAKQLNGEVISMDSRQVYRRMDIGTAKATPAQRAAVPHFGLDLVEPSERYSAGRFARDASAWIDDIAARGRLPILVGGTGFFLRALTHPLFDEPDLPVARREALKRFLRDLDALTLARWLDALDPQAAAALQSAGGSQRMARAIEVVLLTGHPLSWWHAHAPAAVPLDPLVFVLELPRALLYPAINGRVGEMLERGLVAEVRALLAAGFGSDDPGMNATGYAEILPFLRGEYDLPAATDAIQRATRRYARRQETWFRHQLPAGAIHLDARRSVEDLTEQIARTWAEVSSAHRN